jgi:carbonic anhydrase/acetyltransferase-like protein (isoleucine patch superfamily)
MKGDTARPAARYNLQLMLRPYRGRMPIVPASVFVDVAAGALVIEGSLVQPRSLVMGRPATIRRALTDEKVASIRDYVERYVGYRLDYMVPSGT